ncbi:hypothetical protein Tco_1420878 [Tanacetum coccineum]
MESQSETTQTVSALKLPVLKTREYDLWSMRMEQYLTFTVLPFGVGGMQKVLWEAIKNRFRGNKESKKMQKIILKQNYENFATSSQEGPDKTYDRFQKLISQLEISMVSYLSDTLSMDDLYNNLKVYESEIKGKLSSSLNSQNVAFVSSDNSSSTNERVNTDHNVSTASSKDQASTTSYADDVMFYFFAKPHMDESPNTKLGAWDADQSKDSIFEFLLPLYLDYEDLEQIDADDLEEMDLKC